MIHSSPMRHFLQRWLDIEPQELSGLLSAFGCVLTMFTAYSILRPIRETMGITSGVSSLPWLFWGTFICMLAVQPIYGALLSRQRRAQVLPRIYAFFSVMIAVFYLWFILQPDHTWIARVYFIWVSVFNLFVVAVFWSLMADVFNRQQAGRLFGIIAGGMSAGGLLGPLLAVLLARPLGTINLLLVSATLLLISAVLMRRVVRWHGSQPRATRATVDVDSALKGNAWSAFALVFKSPYLVGIALFVFLLSSVSTLLYLEQQRLVAAAIYDSDTRTAFFATLDFCVQGAALLVQVLLFARMQRRFGFAATIVLVPALMIAGFGAIAVNPSFTVVIAVMFVRRVGEFGFVRPCRDMLFTVVSREEKYKAKALLDTFIYRCGDALSASAYAGVVALGSSFHGAAGLAGIAVAGAWVAVALWLARRFATTPVVDDAFQAIGVGPNEVPDGVWRALDPSAPNDALAGASGPASSSAKGFEEPSAV